MLKTLYNEAYNIENTQVLMLRKHTRPIILASGP